MPPTQPQPKPRPGFFRRAQRGLEEAGGDMYDLYSQVFNRRKARPAAAKPAAKVAKPAAPPARPGPALRETGQRGAPLPGGRRVVLGRDAAVNRRLEELERESPF